MRVVIAEDELPAVERLHTLIKDFDPAIQVVASLDSVEDLVQWLKMNPHPDLLLLDIHLSDGHSFEIFRRINYSGPVIFTTAFDQYALEAFKVFSIDYILKPVSRESLARAIQKFRTITGVQISPDYARLVEALKKPNYKDRFLGKSGAKLYFIEADEVAYFQADNKIVYLVDKKGNKFIVNHTLDKLLDELDPRQFFRLSRRVIVRISAIEHVKPYYNNRLKVAVKGNGEDRSEDLVISRERVAEFRNWAAGQC
ncbi:MAG: LytTR family DNA-binding domain-containing protein [Chitinophagaceae bacterium]|nr:LytTR family DNA-binding domain-containing protein [Chitinophagaceae bacterium]